MAVVGRSPLVVSSAAVLALALHGRRVWGCTPVIVCNKTLQRAAGSAPAPGQPYALGMGIILTKGRHVSPQHVATSLTTDQQSARTPALASAHAAGRPAAAATAPQQAPAAALVRPGCSDTSSLAQQPPGPHRAKERGRGGNAGRAALGTPPHHATPNWELREGVRVVRVGAGLGVSAPCPWISFSLQKRDQRAFQIG